LKQPPQAATIGQVFQISIYATVGDGSALSRAMIECTAIRNVELGALSSAAGLSQLMNNVPKTNPTVDLEKDYPEFKENYYKALIIDTKITDLSDARSTFQAYNKKVIEYNIPPNLTMSLKRQYLEMFLETVDKHNFLSLFGKGETDLTTLTSTSKRTNVMTDATEAAPRTNSKGIASLSLKFLSGVSDTYALICQSGTTFTQKSQSIKLTNPITSVTFLQNLKQSFEVKFDKASNGALKPTYSKLAKAAKVQAWIGPNKKYTDKIYTVAVKLINKDIVDAVKKIIETEITGIKIDELEIIEQLGRSGPSVKAQLSQFWNVLTTAANSIKMAMGSSTLEESKNVRLTIADDGSNELSELELLFEKPGDYYISVTMNGIESELSDIITVKQYEEKETYKRITPILCTILVYVLCAVMIISNLPNSSRFMPIFSILLAAFGISLFLYTSQYALFFVIMMVALLGIIIIHEIVRLINMLKGNKDYTSHKAMKVRLFQEYTFRRLFGCPSTTWVFL